MPDKNKKFHEFALNSGLFKGRSDWYFCYLKAEKIAHVLTLLAGQSTLPNNAVFEELVHSASTLPRMVVHFAAGEIELSLVLADMFALISGVRLAGTAGTINKENSLILINEYESLAEKLAGMTRLSPLLMADDFSIPPLPDDTTPLLSGRSDAFGPAPALKDTKGHSYKGHVGQVSKAQTERVSLILSLVRKNQGVSIKDLSKVVTGCSEKTIQRELAGLIEKGLIRKEGERRWSLYYPV